MTWSDVSYRYKKKITIDHTKVSGDEVDFPVLISVTDANLADISNGGHVQSSSGYDIVFYNSAEDTLLKHEIQQYTNTSGLLIFWVKVPVLSSTSNTIIYIYYGKAGVAADPSSTDTWDSGFFVVYHMDNSSGDLTDSTANGRTTSAVKTPHYQETGKIGYCVGFDAWTSDPNGDYFTDILPFGDINLQSLAVEIWTKQTGSGWDIMFGAPYGGQNRFYFSAYEGGGHDDYYTGWGSTYTHWGTYTGGDWIYQAYVGDTGYTIGCYEDGGSLSAIADSSTFSISDGPHIASFDNTYGYWDGEIDEVRMSNSIRSENWFATTYENENSPSTFISFSVEMTIAGIEMFLNTLSKYGNEVYISTDKLGFDVSQSTLAIN